MLFVRLLIEVTSPCQAPTHSQSIKHVHYVRRYKMAPEELARSHEIKGRNGLP